MFARRVFGPSIDQLNLPGIVDDFERFYAYCDDNADDKLTQQEFNACLAGAVEDIEADLIDSLWNHIMKLSAPNQENKPDKAAIKAEYVAFRDIKTLFEAYTSNTDGNLSGYMNEQIFSNPTSNGPSELAYMLGARDQQSATDLFRLIDIGGHGYLSFPDFYRTYRGLQVQEKKFEAVWTELAGSDGQTTV